MGVVVGVVLAAAVVHAWWNLLAKAISSRWSASALIAVGGFGCGVIMVAVSPPPPAAAWPYLVVSAVAQAGYLLLLTTTYRHGDLGRLYPLARGTAPLLVTVFSVVVLREQLSPWALVGVVVLLVAFALLATGDGVPRRGVGYALATGCVITLYTIVDGLGVRETGDPFGYVGWQFVIQGPLVLTVSLVLGSREHGGLSAHLATIRGHLLRGLLGGVLSFASYGAVVWAQGRAPLAVVSALRETSVIWAALLGWLVLRERMTRARAVAVALAAIGAALVR